LATKKILIISDHPADFYSLGAALDRAGTDRFKCITASTRDQPVDALMDPANHAVILAYKPETEYLLRLAKKKQLALPVIVMRDEESVGLVKRLKVAEASDHLVRGLSNDETL